MLKILTTASCLAQVCLDHQRASRRNCVTGPLEYLATPAPADDVRIETGVRQSDQVRLNLILKRK